MIVYLGDTRSHRLVAEMHRRHAGVMVLRGRLRSRTRAFRWAYDNGAWCDHVAGRPFDFDAWQRDLDVIAGLPTPKAPDFCVLPDIVCGGLRSLELSLKWLPKVRHVHWHWYLPVQDGMTPDDLPKDGCYPDWLAGLFIGGSTEWKFRTAPFWREVCNREGWLMHVGRVGSMQRIRAARAAGTGSIDSADPLRTVGHWERFWRELNTPQQQLFTPAIEHDRAHVWRAEGAA